MVAMTIDLQELEAEVNQRPAQYVCRLCCGLVILQPCENGCCVITHCPRHPSIMIRQGKVVGTSA